MNDFRRDDEWQRQVRDAVLAPGFYGVYAVDGRYVFIDKGRLASVLQKRYAVDTILQARDGAAVCIEEKIVRWPGHVYTAFCLETHSCTVAGHESPGWMQYGKADYLLYCFVQESGDLDCYLIDFPELQRWFFLYIERFAPFGPLPTLNRTMGRVVPIADVRANVTTFRRMVFAGKPSPAKREFAEHERRVENAFNGWQSWTARQLSLFDGSGNDRR